MSPTCIASTPLPETAVNELQSRKQKLNDAETLQEMETYLYDVVNEGIFKHPVQSDAVVLQDVLNTQTTNNLSAVTLARSPQHQP